MGLKETQTVMARLLTQARLREAFFADPGAVGRTLGLTEAEVTQLAALTSPTTESIARSLQNKRLGEIRKLLPRTCDLLGQQLVPLFRRFARDFTPQGVGRHREDALAFASFLLRTEEWQSASPELHRAVRHESTALKGLPGFLTRFLRKLTASRYYHYLLERS